MLLYYLQPSPDGWWPPLRAETPPPTSFSPRLHARPERCCEETQWYTLSWKNLPLNVGYKTRYKVPPYSKPAICILDHSHLEGLVMSDTGGSRVIVKELI